MRPAQVPASNSEARKRAQRQGHPDPAVRELLARAWGEGFHAPGPRDDQNPYRSES